MKRVGAVKWMVLACAGLVAGCTSELTPTNAKLEKGLNAYFEGHNECLFPAGQSFPYEVSPAPGAKEKVKQFDAMKDAGLLTEVADLEMHVERYTLSPLGERVAPRFCYGHKVVTSVDGFTAPVKKDGVLETTVNYHATMEDVPVWAKTDALKAAFPTMAGDISGAAEGQMVMATAGVGWSVR